jgi:putative NIF3 family GTP cyclohydrolase 1 type 2
MVEAHPYDEVAYDIYELANKPVDYGCGRVGSLPEATTLGHFAELVRSALNLSHVKTAGNVDMPVCKVALCGGGASSLFREAVNAGADVYITGDTKHHDVLDANALGLAVIDAGHFETERPGMAALAERLALIYTKSDVDVAFIQ